MRLQSFELLVELIDRCRIWQKVIVLAFCRCNRNQRLFSLVLSMATGEPGNMKTAHMKTAEPKAAPAVSLQPVPYIGINNTPSW